jgi:8-oxo-dGTP pyrophosphatase MutT (NUDIX family)
MPISDYARGIRELIGRRLLLVPGAAAIVHDEAGRVLLERRSDGGLWGPPAGAVDPGETPAQAIVREVLEETGLSVEPTGVVAVLGGPDYRFAYANGDLCEYVTTVFACRVLGGELRPADGESLDLRYFRTDDLPPLHLPYPPAIFRHPPAAGRSSTRANPPITGLVIRLV